MLLESQAPHFHTVRGMRLAYWRFGDPEGQPLLCVHGFLDHGASFRFMAEHLEGVQVVALDVRGHGHSDWVGPGGYYHFYDYYDDCRALLAELGWSRFSLLGHSMGGSIASGLAALEAERLDALVLLEGMGPPYSDLSLTPDRLRHWSTTLRKVHLNAGPDQRRAGRKVMADTADAARRLQGLNRRLPESRALALAETLTEPVEGGVSWRYDPLHRTPAAKPYLQGEAEAFWRAIEAPVLSVHGTETGWRVRGLSERHTHFRNITTAVLPEAGHNLHHDRPDAVADFVKTWMNSPGRCSSVLENDIA